MRNLLSRATAVAVLGLFAIPSRADAAVVWNWSFGTTEAGTFTTNGTVADTSGFFDFEITDFMVNSSTVSGLIGRPYSENQPAQGFLWDGDSASQFYRSGGAYTNGSNFYVPDVDSRNYQFLFFANGSGALGNLGDPSENTVVSFSSLTLNPVSPVPEPGTNLAMLALGASGLTLRRRLKAKAA
jgi:hypothetical protein